MRKAASQTLRVLFTVLVLVVVFLFSATLVRAYSVDPNMPVSEDQDTGDFIAGNIRIEGTTAIGTVVNHGTDNVKVGLASYTQTDGDIENQTLYASTESDLGPGETKDLRVEIPCWSQVDLFRIFPERPGQDGGVITSFKGNVRYGQRLISAVHTMNECNQEQETPTPSATPTETSTPTTTEAPRTDLTDNRSDNLGCSVHDCSGNVIGVGGVVAGVSTSAQLPSTGTSMQLISLLLGTVVLSLGVVLVRTANKMEK